MVDKNLNTPLLGPFSFPLITVSYFIYLSVEYFKTVFEELIPIQINLAYYLLTSKCVYLTFLFCICFSGLDCGLVLVYSVLHYLLCLSLYLRLWSRLHLGSGILC